MDRFAGKCCCVAPESGRDDIDHKPGATQALREMGDTGPAVPTAFFIYNNDGCFVLDRQDLYRSEIKSYKTAMPHHGGGGISPPALQASTDPEAG
ncbi:hypothetical protein AA0614_1430 [Komagataeibacter saccharivorans NRIC 0614]|nr:hypothetical protein AA0614_1430 [Komagataeibacter saccharivorans NRIC 0614]